jgi:hypothetical protein
VVLWLVSPFALVLALPAAHAGLVASAARRRWHLAALLGVALLPIVALAATAATRLDANPFFAIWYLIDTAASGSRGPAGVVLAALIGACLWSLASLAAVRARKGSLAAARPRRRPRRPRRPRPAPAGPR